ncbi:MAG: replication-relaxation family protein [Candidatus Pacebacteria bacterium]|nr:replication-relaxation family protein [Candidatus Paceibacterota bacterium]
MGGRRNPFQRACNSFILQERDKKLIAFCHDYRFLTQEQIRVLSGFGCQTRINIRLRKLFDAGYLSRRFLPVFQGRARILYFVGSRGEEIIAAQAGVDPVKIRQRRKQLLQIKDGSLSHYLAISEFRLAFFMASKHNPAISLNFWRTEKEMPLCLEQKKFYSDACLVYGYRDKFFSLFLEIDRSTESHKRFGEKINNYLRYGLHGHYQKQFGVQFFRVLIVCPSLSRLENLKRLIEQKTDKMFWLTVAGDITPEKILSKIWHRPGQGSLASFLEN